MRSNDAKHQVHLPPLQDRSSDATSVAELAKSNAAEPSNPEIIPDSEASQHVMLGRGARSIANPGNVVFRDQIIRSRKAEVRTCACWLAGCLRVAALPQIGPDSKIRPNLNAFYLQ